MGKKVNETKRIFDAIENGNTEMVKQLIANGIDVNTCNEEENLSLLSAAVHSGNAEIVEFLLDNGADVNAEDSQTFIPLHYAVHSGSLEMIKLLLAHGADAKKTECMRITPFCSGSSSAFIKTRA